MRLRPEAVIEMLGVLEVRAQPSCAAPSAGPVACAALGVGVAIARVMRAAAVSCWQVGVPSKLVWMARVSATR